MPGVSAITCEGVDEAVANEVVEVAAKGALDERGVNKGICPRLGNDTDTAAAAVAPSGP